MAQRRHLNEAMRKQAQRAHQKELKHNGSVRWWSCQQNKERLQRASNAKLGEFGFHFKDTREILTISEERLKKIWAVLYVDNSGR